MASYTIDDDNECDAPDCDENTTFPRDYCSSTCRNVGLQVSSIVVNNAIDGKQPYELGDERIAEIRENVEKNHKIITEKIEDQMDE